MLLFIELTPTIGFLKISSNVREFFKPGKGLRCADFITTTEEEKSLFKTLRSWTG